MENTRLYILLILCYISMGLVGITWFNPQWTWVGLVWFFYAIGNGTIGHRYFAHNSFSVSRLMHRILALWCTLCAYAPLHYWKVQHLHHHRNADSDKDIHSPHNGFLRAFLLWPFSAQRLEAVFRERASLIILAKALKDPVISFFSRRFFAINVIFLLLVMLLDPLWLLEILGVAYLIEQIRLGLINTVTHLPSWPGNYINHQHSGTDQSQNNWILGMITLGFAWHNNHHASPAKLILTERWWEIDVEGYVGWLFSLTARQESKNVEI